MIDQVKLIPGINEWNFAGQKEFGISDWIAMAGDIKYAIGYSSIFWPDFIEHEGGIFLKSHFSVEGFNQWKEVEYVELFSQIEYVINHVHILDLFSNENQTHITKDQVIYLGGVMKEMYEAKLATQYIEKKFRVIFNGHEDLEDLFEYELSFNQYESEARRMKSGS